MSSHLRELECVLSIVFMNAGGSRCRTPMSAYQSANRAAVITGLSVLSWAVVIVPVVALRAVV